MGWVHSVQSPARGCGRSSENVEKSLFNDAFSLYVFLAFYINDLVLSSASHPQSSLCSRFPLQDPVRLQQWLRNMRRANWAPSRHQYICHEHFAPSCFKVRWGIRYLESDAVPTVFQDAEVKHQEASLTITLARRYCAESGLLFRKLVICTTIFWFMMCSRCDSIEKQ